MNLPTQHSPLLRAAAYLHIKAPLIR